MASTILLTDVKVLADELVCCRHATAPRLEALSLLDQAETANGSRGFQLLLKSSVAAPVLKTALAETLSNCPSFAGRLVQGKAGHSQDPQSLPRCGGVNNVLRNLLSRSPLEGLTYTRTAFRLPSLQRRSLAVPHPLPFFSTGRDEATPLRPRPLALCPLSLPAVRHL